MRRKLTWSDVTPKPLWLNRRQIIAGSAAMLAGPALVHPAHAQLSAAASRFSTDEPPTSLEDITSYNNFYEFGTGKEDPAENAKGFKTTPWTVTVEGLVKNPNTAWDLNDLLAKLTLYDRTYRMRCVEGWSMVIPWRGIPLKDVIDRARPRASAKYVEFTTLMDPRRMPGQRFPILDWPYVEGLRMDEARHPLTLLATGVYGRDLPNQNGAPLRLVVPWKYGFKGIKSIVKIRFTDRMPNTTWNDANPSEYGFYANVNPAVDHPRWSQAKERRIGEFLRRNTLPFNGYADQVASLYSGMDLRKFY